MNRAIDLALKGCGWVNPNPLVGAVMVKDGQIIGEGWHERYGGFHAERNVFKNCIEDTVGAELYVTLEPCCHHGKTPPCTEVIIEHQICRVVVGVLDPNPLVAGKGVEKLRAAGIEVLVGVETDKIREMNRVFLKYIATGIPWIVMKTAMTLDGKIAAYSGDSKWVTGEEARHRVQQMRSEYMGIMVGSGTVKADDPMLNCRLEGEVRQPIRIVVDSGAGIAMDCKLVCTAKEFRTIVAHTKQAAAAKLALLSDAGVETWLCDESEGRISIVHLLKQLGAAGVDAVLLEGGGELNDTFIRGGFVDEVFAFIAPKIVGGKEAKTPVEGLGFERISDSVVLADVKMEKLGEDFLICGQIKKRDV